MRRGFRFPGRRPAPEQLELPFRSRMRRLERGFKWGVVAFTALAVLTPLVATSAGRAAADSLVTQARWSVLRLVGGQPTREQIEARTHRLRMQGIEQTRAALRRAARDRGPAMERLLRVSGMDPDSAVIRWGNFDWTLVLSSDLFEPDDSGRSYRMKPRTEAVWVVGLSLHNAPVMFLIPDTPEARQAAGEAGGRVVPESAQTTNSWGFRGPEPELDAPIRGLVLGDSVMQGALIGDDETPPAQLERELAEALGTRVSVLNTGVLGYSPEQYYFTLLETFERLRPDFVVIAVCGNDFGDVNEPANWDETEHWLGLIGEFCRSRGLLHFLLVPAPNELELLGRRNTAVYPGQVVRVYKLGGAHYVDPIEAFTDEQLRLRNEAIRNSEPWSPSPLYNGHLGDKHFSALGSSVWAEVVARRLALLMQGKAPPPS